MQRVLICTRILLFYSIVEMDQLTPGLIREAYERSREVHKQIEELGFKQNGILPDTQTKKRKKDELEENIKRLENENDALWEYRDRLRGPTYRVRPG